jgi:hypothetical protein
MRSLTLVLLAAVLGAASAGAGPPGPALSARCRDSGDRATKLTLIAALPRSPQILILGSSRAREAEPSFLRRLTGRSGFNAAVTGGTAADAWVMTRFGADRWPSRARRYLLFVDAGIATNGIPPDLAADPRARRYLGAESTAGRTSPCRVSRSRYRADGSIAHHYPKPPAERARVVAKSVAEVLAHIRTHPPHAEQDNPARYAYFERTIAFMNQHGARPVIVLNPIHPRVLAELEKYGFPKRKAALEYLGRLRRRLDFVVVDCEDIRTWGGSAANFTNATHVDRVNMRRMLRYIVSHADGALR